MKKYEVVLFITQYETYEINAESEEEARAEALGGNAPSEVVGEDSEVISVKEITGGSSDETYKVYKGFGIRYVSITGTTFVEEDGVVIEQFNGKGELEGNRLAIEFIDMWVIND